MKKLVCCFLLFLTWSARAQSFEGTIKWSMKMEIADPAVKAKMEAAQAQASTPEAQAKMKAMQDKMNDPQMKAAMDANPQMKAQMEAAMRAAAGGNPTSMMPTGLIIKIKGDNSLTKMEGGPMSFEVLFLKDKDMSYMLDRTAKTYSVLPSGGRPGQQEATPKVTKTSETAKILGYNCTKYLVEITEHGRTLNEAIWTTTDIKNFDFKKFARAKMGRGQSMYFEGMEGVPMRVEMKEAAGSSTMEVTEIKPESLPASDFVVPSDFKETPGGFGRF